MHMRDFKSAQGCLEKVLACRKFKDNYEAMRYMAYTKNRLGQREEACALYKKVIEINPKDWEANLEIGKFYEMTDVHSSLIYYENGLRLIESEIASQDKINGFSE